MKTREHVSTERETEQPPSKQFIELPTSGVMHSNTMRQPVREFHHKSPRKDASSAWTCAHLVVNLKNKKDTGPVIPGT